MVLFSVLLQRLFTPGCCEGPDLVAYAEIAARQSEQSDFWMRADAFESNFWGMLYPTFLHYAQLVTGGSLEAIQWIQRVFVAVLVPGAWLLTAHLGRRVRCATVLVLVLSPTTFWLGNSYGYEVLLALFLTFGVVLAWGFGGKEFFQSSRLNSLVAVASGLLIGLAVLTQSKAIVALPVIVFLLWRQKLGRIWWGALSFFITVLPWMLRNLVVLGTPSPFSNNAGYNLWVGNNPEAVLGGSLLTAPPLPPGVTSQLRAGLDFIISQPEAMQDLFFRKVVRLWQPLYVYPEFIPVGPGRTMLHLVAGLLAALVVIGFVLFLGGRLFSKPPIVPNVTPIAVLVLLFASSHLPFIAEPRFMTVVYPLTLSVAVPTLLYLARNLRAAVNGPRSIGSESESSIER